MLATTSWNNKQENLLANQTYNQLVLLEQNANI